MFRKASRCSTCKYVRTSLLYADCVISMYMDTDGTAHHACGLIVGIWMDIVACACLLSNVV